MIQKIKPESYKPCPNPPQAKIIAAKDSVSQKLARDPKVIQGLQSQAGANWYSTKDDEKTRKKICSEPNTLVVDVPESTKSVLLTLEARLIDDGKKLTPGIKKKFLNRFIPFYYFGDGNDLVYDKKTKRVYLVNHEEDLPGMIERLPFQEWENIIKD